MRRGSLEAAFIAAAITVPHNVGAQVGSADLQRFDPPPSPDGALATEPTTTPGPWAWGVGSFIAYDYRALALSPADSQARSFAIRHRWSVDTFAVLGIGESLALSLAVPTVVYQGSDDLRAEAGIASPAHTGIGDVRLRAKANLVAPDELGGGGLALIGGLWAPTGSRDAQLSSGAYTGELHAAFELRLLILNLYSQVGGRFRSQTGSWLGDEYGHELPWSAGLSLLPQALDLDDSGQWRWNAEIKGAAALTPTFFASKQSPVSGALSLAWDTGDFRVLAGAEVPLRQAVGVPAIRAIAGLVWSPSSPDEDRDGIPDEQDVCPELEEDPDGYDDSDGCPDFDDDNDGVADEEDKCREEEEDQDGYQDQDGCPDPDNDSDGILDAADECPNEPGQRLLKGCPPRDTDKDGLADHLDRCPAQAEDKDGFKDGDGCPDVDNAREGSAAADQSQTDPLPAPAAPKSHTP